jgi:hyperosmotically inducible protein
VKHLRGTVCLLAASIALAACSNPPANVPSPTMTRLEGAANDALITTTVKAKLITVDVDSTVSLGVHVHDGNVVLTGAVRSADARAKAVAAAKTVSGVKSVSDELHVDPRVPSVRERLGDAALAGRITGAIVTETGSTAVHVDVHAGVVTLRGHVVDPRVRDAAVAAARHTSGVRNVVDEMGG